MNKNLKVKVIKSNNNEDFEKQINDFASTKVNIVATQTSLAIASDASYTVVYMAVVYYNPVVGLPKL